MNAAAPAGSILNTGGITTVLGAVLIIVVLTVAIRATMRAHRSDIAGVLTALGIVAMGALVWALATGNDLPKLGQDLVRAVLSI